MNQYRYRYSRFGVISRFLIFPFLRRQRIHVETVDCVRIIPNPLTHLETFQFDFLEHFGRRRKHMRYHGVVVFVADLR